MLLPLGDFVLTHLLEETYVGGSKVLNTIPECLSDEFRSNS